MKVLMLCGDCMGAFTQRPGGGWDRHCGCTTTRYWCSLAPLAKDLQSFHQLTGNSVQYRDYPMLYRY